MATILVVGAGPAGLTLAAVLSRAGVTPRLIDRATVPRADRSRAIVIQARSLEHFAQLGIGPSAGGLGGGAPRAGDRMPDVDLGEGRRLADELREPGHLLLLFAGEPDRLLARFTEVANDVSLRYGSLVRPVIVRTVPSAASAAVLDAAAVAHRRFGAIKGGAYLVRPDGYIGWRDGECDPAELWPALSKRLRPVLAAPAAV